MADITKIYTQEVPAFRFIGKKYGDEDRVNGGFGAQWGQAFENGLFSRLEQLADQTLFEDAAAYIGLMRCKDNEPFIYAIGMFCPANTPVPEKMDFLIFRLPVWESVGCTAAKGRYTAENTKSQESWAKRDI